MELRCYDYKDAGDEQLISEMKKLDDKAFGTGPNIVGITKEELKNILKNGFILCAIIDGKIVSEVMLEYKKDHWYAGGIATDPEHFRRGLGGYLMREVIKRAKDNKIKATVREDNVESIGLCVNKNGFIVTKFLKDYFGPGKDRLMMELGPEIKDYKLSEDFEEASCNDKEKIKNLLDGGWIGTKLQGKDGDHYLQFSKILK
jgi:ribosomal protein S18 acetylase RimI-like enzyme